MNYIEQINGFWSKSEESDLTGLDIAVYMSLLKHEYVVFEEISCIFV